MKDLTFSRFPAGWSEVIAKPDGVGSEEGGQISL